MARYNRMRTLAIGSAAACALWIGAVTVVIAGEDNAGPASTPEQVATGLARAVTEDQPGLLTAVCAWPDCGPAAADYLAGLRAAGVNAVSARVVRTDRQSVLVQVDGEGRGGVFRHRFALASSADSWALRPVPLP